MFCIKMLNCKHVMPLVFYNMISNLSLTIFLNSQKHYVENDIINNASFEEHLSLLLNYHLHNKKYQKNASLL